MCGDIEPWRTRPDTIFEPAKCARMQLVYTLEPTPRNAPDKGDEANRPEPRAHPYFVGIMRLALLRGADKHRQRHIIAAAGDRFSQRPARCAKPHQQTPARLAYPGHARPVSSA